MEGSRRLQLDRILHGGDYNPEQWLDREDILEEDIRMMKKAGVNAVTLGVFSWSIYEPVEGEYRFDWLEERMNRLLKEGIHTILATPSGARPVWLDETYPEALRVDAVGDRRLHGSRHNHCMSSPAYREKVRQMDEQLALRFGGHPGLLMWHISNELGGECHCPLCRERFQDFLRVKYQGDIEKLNAEWWTTFWSHRFQRFDQIDPPSKRGEEGIHGLNLDWKRFTTWNMADYMKEEIQILRQITPQIPVTTNFMRLYRGLDYHKLAQELDVISFDCYPAWNEDGVPLHQTYSETAFDYALMRSIKPDRPFLLMESVPSLVNWHPYNKLKRPGVHKMASLQAVACGSDSVLYFQWRKGRGSYEQYHGAVVDHLGRDDTRVFLEVAEVGEKLTYLREAAGSSITAKAAIVFDWENRWAIEDMAGLSKHKNYVETVREIYVQLLSHGIEADVISSEADLTPYALIVTPQLYLLKPGVANNLKRFVKDGGVLLATYLSGYVNENALCFLGGFPGDGMTQVFGLYSEEIDTLYPDERNHAIFMGENQKEGYGIRDYCERIKLLGAEAIARYGDDFYAGEPVVCRHAYEKGKAWYVAARLEAAGMERVLSQVCAESGLEWKELPTGLELHVRRRGKEEYRFMMNMTEKELIYEGTVLEPLSALVELHKETGEKRVFSL